MEISRRKIIIGAVAALLIFLTALMATKLFLFVSRLFFGALLLLFLPGFLITEISFPRGNMNKEVEEIDWIERLAFSFVFSIIAVSLAVYFLNLIGVAVTADNIFLEASSLIVVLVFTLSKIKSRNKKRYSPVDK